MSQDNVKIYKASRYARRFNFLVIILYILFAVKSFNEGSVFFLAIFVLGALLFSFGYISALKWRIVISPRGIENICFHRLYLIPLYYRYKMASKIAWPEIKSLIHKHYLFNDDYYIISRDNGYIHINIPYVDKGKEIIETVEEMSGKKFETVSYFRRKLD